MLTTLEEIAMPQNGIYHAGITALSQAFSHNKNLKILNLNDNTITVKGAQAIADILPGLQNLKSINFGDCLLKTEGALSIATGKKKVNFINIVLIYLKRRTKERAPEPGRTYLGLQRNQSRRGDGFGGHHGGQSEFKAALPQRQSVRV